MPQPDEEKPSGRKPLDREPAPAADADDRRRRGPGPRPGDRDHGQGRRPAADGVRRPAAERSRKSVDFDGAPPGPAGGRRAPGLGRRARSRRTRARPAEVRRARRPAWSSPRPGHALRRTAGRCCSRPGRSSGSTPSRASDSTTSCSVRELDPFDDGAPVQIDPCTSHPFDDGHPASVPRDPCSTYAHARLRRPPARGLRRARGPAPTRRRQLHGPAAGRRHPRHRLRRAPLAGPRRRARRSTLDGSADRLHEPGHRPRRCTAT